MVVFNCNTCGDIMKKNQVEKHTIKCYSCNILSCVDCGKDFLLNTYKEHTTCITEAEKYSGKNYQPKLPKGNPNKTKQDAWLVQVQNAIKLYRINIKDKKVAQLLEKIHDQTNIPRKKKKFINFVSKTWPITKSPLIESAWLAINVDGASEQTVMKNNSDESTNKVIDCVDTSEDVKNKPKKRKISDCSIDEINSDCIKKSTKSTVKLKKKFKWEDQICKLLKKQEMKSLSMKKLKKKIFAEYESQTGNDSTSTKIQDKFTKKLNNSEAYKVVGGKVLLCEN